MNKIILTHAVPPEAPAIQHYQPTDSTSENWCLRFIQTMRNACNVENVGFFAPTDNGKVFGSVVIYPSRRDKRRGDRAVVKAGLAEIGSEDPFGLSGQFTVFYRAGLTAEERAEFRDEQLVADFDAAVDAPSLSHVAKPATREGDYEPSDYTTLGHIVPDDCWIVLLWDPDGSDTSPWSVRAPDIDSAIAQAKEDWVEWLFDPDESPEERPTTSDAEVFKIYRNSWIGQRVFQD